MNTNTKINEDFSVIFDKKVKYLNEYEFFVHRQATGMTGYYGRTFKEFIETYGLNKKKKTNELVFIRYIAFNVLWTTGKMNNLSAIGRMFNKDHATVYHGLRAYDELIESGDKMFAKFVEKFTPILMSLDIE
jgi:hypothetical protein